MMISKMSVIKSKMGTIKSKIGRKFEQKRKAKMGKRKSKFGQGLMMMVISIKETAPPVAVNFEDHYSMAQ